MAVTLASFCLLVVVAALGPHRPYASIRSSLGHKRAAAAAAPAVGICASSVLVYGYQCQELQVTTQDGYILSLQRIPEGRHSNGTKKPPVLIQHGLLVDGVTWLLNSPDRNLPLILADNGFDVWIANTRGTRFSRRHTSMDPSDPKFWNWSWDELVAFDLPAVFDFVYSKTGQKVNYVGHSLGTLFALASLSDGKLVDQMKSAALLSPIAYLSHMNTALGVAAAKAFVGEITTLFGLAEFNPKGEPVAQFLNALCVYPGVDCYDLLEAVTGIISHFSLSLIINYLAAKLLTTSVNLSDLREKLLPQFFHC
ncbi:unnamed protein product [Prunus armeniaca]